MKISWSALLVLVHALHFTDMSRERLHLLWLGQYQVSPLCRGKSYSTEGRKACQNVFASHMLRFMLLLILEGGFLPKDFRDFDFVLLSAAFIVWGVVMPFTVALFCYLPLWCYSLWKGWRIRKCSYINWGRSWSILRVSLKNMSYFSLALQLDVGQLQT